MPLFSNPPPSEIQFLLSCSGHPKANPIGEEPNEETISRRDLARESYLAWNALIDLIALNDYESLTPTQRVAHLVFWYDSEVQNGGHLQYFDNRGIGRLNETMDALDEIGAECQRGVLSWAARKRLARPRRAIRNVKEYVRAARAGEFDREDAAYYECQPEICTELLHSFLDAHFNEFIDLVD